MFGGVLQRRIDRGVDDDILIELADQIVDRIHHPVGDVIDRAGGWRLDRMRRMGERQLGASGRDHFQFHHVGEHERRAALGAVRIAARRQPRRRLHQAGEHGRFGERQVPRRFAEIALRRPLDAVSAGAEIDAVEIEFENLRLGEFVFEPQREHDFLKFAGDGAFLGEEQIFGELLGDGRAALRRAAMKYVGDERARDAERIDAAMRVKAAVLDGDEGVGHVIRQFADGDRGAAHVAARRQRRAVDAEDEHRGRTLGYFQGLDRRQTDADPDERADAADQRPQRQHGAPIGGAAEHRTRSAGSLALARLAWGCVSAAPASSRHAAFGGLFVRPLARLVRRRARIAGRRAGAILRR